MDKNVVLKELESFEQETGFKVELLEANEAEEIDGYANISLSDKDVEKFAIELKKELRNHQLPQLFKLKERHPKLLVIAEYISPKIKDALKEKEIGYIDSAANTYLKTNHYYVLIKGKELTKKPEKDSDRAFTKTGLKVLLHFLINDELLNKTYRDIANKTGVSLDTVSKVINSLKKQNFILAVNSKRKALVNKKELFERWVTNYENKLKQNLWIGDFKALDKEFHYKWKKNEFNWEKTVWSGEPAADILTNNFKPEIYTLYTEENKNELIKNYKFLPAEKNQGSIKAFKKFWKDNIFRDDRKYEKTAPLLIVYSDLVNTGDPRDIEIAKQIYEQKLKDLLEENQA